MELETAVEVYSIAIAGLGLIYAMFRNLKTDLKERIDSVQGSLKEFKEETNQRFDKIDDRFLQTEARFPHTDSKIEQLRREMKEAFYKLEDSVAIAHDMIDDVKSDLSEVKERMAFLEAANIYTMPLQASEPNPRSQAARELWKRRRAKKIEKKDG